MSNIGAIKVKDKKTLDEYLIFVADSLSTDMRTKNDNKQKIFRIGDFLLTGTGVSLPITNIYIELKLDPSRCILESSEDLAKKVIRIAGESDLVRLSEKDHLSLIVGGKDKSELGVYHINITGKPNNAGGKREYKRVDCAFNGSNAEVIEQFVDKKEGSIRLRREIDNLADGFRFLYQLGKTAANLLTVNDKLQFGIVSSKGVSTLYHPDVDLFSPRQYFSEISGIEVPNLHNPEIVSDLRRKGKLGKVSNLQRYLRMIARDVYYALDSDLRDYCIAEDPARGIIALCEGGHRELESKRKTTRKQVMQGIEALMSGNIDELIKYKKDYERRQKKQQKEVEKEALLYIG